MYKTDRISLSPIRMADSGILYKWINDKDLVHFNNMYLPIIKESHDQWFNNILQKNDLYIFGIRTILDDTLIGTCQLHSIDNLNQHAELQIRIGKIEQQSKGFGTEAVNLLIQFGWRELNLRKIYLYVFGDNQKAIKTYEKIGFIEEGILKEHFFIDGKFKDIKIMSIFNKKN